MSELIKYQPPETPPEGPPETSGLRPVEPRLDVRVRLATQDDFDAIDALQKAEKDGLGFQFESAIRKRIEQGNLIVAEVDRVFAGYCLGVDRYQKRSELGIIYQMGVVPKYRRSLVAARLLQAQFDKSAYGTRLYCCWCKQSLEANRFWEAMGFVPLAFRAAGRNTIEKFKKKGNVAGAVHIFWQKRIRIGDTGDPANGGTPWWYPYETQGGAMMEGRVVLPLPPEVQWHEATPVVLPGAERRANETRMLEDTLSDVEKRERDAKKGKSLNRQVTKNAKEGRGIGVESKPSAPRAVGMGGFGAGSGFGESAKATAAVPDNQALLTKDDAELARLEAEKAAAKQALKAAQRKNDPELVAYARELRDRWQEHVTMNPLLLEDKQRGQYAVGRLLGFAKPDSASRMGGDVDVSDVNAGASNRMLDAA